MMNTFQFIGFGWRCWRTEGPRNETLDAILQLRDVEIDQFQLMRQALLIGRFQQSRSEFPVNLDRTADYPVRARQPGAGWGSRLTGAKATTPESK